MSVKTVKIALWGYKLVKTAYGCFCLARTKRRDRYKRPNSFWGLQITRK